jgi:hypothetical protein
MLFSRSYKDPYKKPLRQFFSRISRLALTLEKWTTQLQLAQSGYPAET